MKPLLLILALSTLLAGCATPAGYSNQPLQTYDKDTEYRIEEAQDGFTVTVYYSRYQFIPETSATFEACKSALTNIAYDHADHIGKPIEQINEQRIRVSSGRNGLTGITSCSATTSAKFKSR